MTKKSPRERSFSWIRNDLRFGAYIRYETDVSKGEAWNHLWENAPVINFKGAQYTPYFEPISNDPNGKPRHKNPYRKDPVGQYWCWFVLKWVAAPAVPRGHKRPPPPPRKTRYELLTDDAWFGVQDPE